MTDTATPPSRHVPAATKRAVLEEAGYQCAVPNCRAETLLIMRMSPNQSML